MEGTAGESCFCCFPLQFKWFQMEVLQAVEKKVKLDEEYIQVLLVVGLPRLLEGGVTMVLEIHTNWLL